MIHFTQADKQMLDHVVDVMGDRIACNDGYTEQDEATMTKLQELAKAGPAVVLDGNHADETDLFRRIVAAEMADWVPNASQRLLFRAGLALGVKQPNPSLAVSADCGPERIQHATVPDWVTDVYVHRCVSCLRLFQA